MLRVDADLQAAAVDASRPEFFDRCLAALDQPRRGRRPRPETACPVRPRGPRPSRHRPTPGPSGGRPTAITCSSVRSVAIAGILIPWREQRGVPTARLRGPARASR